MSFSEKLAGPPPPHPKTSSLTGPKHRPQWSPSFVEACLNRDGGSPSLGPLRAWGMNFLLRASYNNSSLCWSHWSAGMRGQICWAGKKDYEHSLWIILEWLQPFALTHSSLTDSGHICASQKAWRPTAEVRLFAKSKEPLADVCSAAATPCISSVFSSYAHSHTAVPEPQVLCSGGYICTHCPDNGTPLFNDQIFLSDIQLSLFKQLKTSASKSVYACSHFDGISQLSPLVLYRRFKYLPGNTSLVWHKY